MERKTDSLNTYKATIEELKNKCEDLKLVIEEQRKKIEDLQHETNSTFKHQSLLCGEYAYIQEKLTNAGQIVINNSTVTINRTK